MVMNHLYLYFLNFSSCCTLAAIHTAPHTGSSISDLTSEGFERICA